MKRKLLLKKLQEHTGSYYEMRIDHLGAITPNGRARDLEPEVLQDLKNYITSTHLERIDEYFRKYGYSAGFFMWETSLDEMAFDSIPLRVEEELREDEIA